MNAVNATRSRMRLVTLFSKFSLPSVPPPSNCIWLRQHGSHLFSSQKVLHISLLRFVFSAETASRSKSQDSISYPLKLNMGRFLPKPVDGPQPEAWYDLKGVLMHKGTSAHHGHYVAQVHDGRYVVSSWSSTVLLNIFAPGKTNGSSSTTML